MRYYILRMESEKVGLFALQYLAVFCSYRTCFLTDGRMLADPQYGRNDQANVVMVGSGGQGNAGAPGFRGQHIFFLR